MVKGKSKGSGKRNVKFTLAAPDAQSVFLAGNFNNWSVDAHPLRKNVKGEWNVSLSLSPGEYEYRFFVDGEWRSDPQCTTFSPNQYGSENCVLQLQMNDIGEKKGVNLEKFILEIVNAMQPISDEELWLEIEEDLNRTTSRTEVKQQLEKMIQEKVLVKTSLKGGRKGFKTAK